LSVQLIRLNKNRLRYSLPNANIKAPKPLKAFISACCLGPFDARLSISLVSRSYFLKSPCSSRLLRWQLILNMAIQLANKRGQHARWNGLTGEWGYPDLGPVGRLVRAAPFSLSYLVLSAFVPAADRAAPLRVLPTYPALWV